MRLLSLAQHGAGKQKKAAAVAPPSHSTPATPEGAPLISILQRIKRHIDTRLRSISIFCLKIQLKLIEFKVGRILICFFNWIEW